MPQFLWINVFFLLILSFPPTIEHYEFKMSSLIGFLTPQRSPLKTFNGNLLHQSKFSEVVVVWLQASSIRKWILQKTCLCWDQETALANCRQPTSLKWCFTIGLSPAWGLAGSWLKSGNFRVSFLSCSFPSSNKRGIRFVAGMLRDKCFWLFVCKAYYSILAVSFLCEGQQLPRTWMEVVFSAVV